MCTNCTINVEEEKKIHVYLQIFLFQDLVDCCTGFRNELTNCSHSHSELERKALEAFSCKDYNHITLLSMFHTFYRVQSNTLNAFSLYYIKSDYCYQLLMALCYKQPELCFICCLFLSKLQLPSEIIKFFSLL